MKSIKYFFTGILIIFFAASCEDFEDLNTNPNEPIEVPSSQLLADVIRLSGNQLYSTFAGGDMGSCWVQQWSKVQYNDEERFNPRQSVIEGLWDLFYADILSDAKSMQQLGASEDNAAIQGAALVMQAYGLHVLTDLYGRVPNTEALRASEGLFTPVYDEQSVVYDSILAKLDRANALLASGSGAINPSFDLLYGGDASKWQKFANSLKFRALMRISGVRNVGADLSALMSRPMFTSADDEAKLIYLETQPNANPIYETIVFGARGEFKVSELLVSTLNNLSDPRLPVFVGENAAGEFRGKPMGIQNVPNDDYNYQNVSPVGDFYLRPEAPAYFVSYAELLFLMAEAAEAGYISGNAADYYNAGVAESMRANGILSGVDAYLAQSSVAYSSANSDQLIGTQKWLALYCQGIEAWTEWRRTGFPVLGPVIDANPQLAGEKPGRFTYPATEQTTNKANYDAAVAAQGPDRLATSVWWMN